MGHPRKTRKKYSNPGHPWESERLEKEKEILSIYALKNKKEIWKMQSILKKYTNQAKRLVNLATEQSEKEKQQMMDKLFKLNLIKKNANVDDVLSLTMNNILDRRLQTLVYKKGLANTQKQARQFITHSHIFVGDKKVNVPSYLVSSDEENKIRFEENSSLIGKFGKIDEEPKKKEVKKEEFSEKKEEPKKKEIKKKEKSKKKIKEETEDGK